MAGLERTVDGLRLRLAGAEVDVLVSLAEGLAARARSGSAVDDRVLDRLAPPVSRNDGEADRELRPLLREDLLALRASRLDDLAVLLRGTTRGAAASDLDRVLTRDEAMRVVEALNDLRLALAVTIDYDGELREDLAEGDHRADAVRLMDALAWLQGGLIEFVEGDGPG